MIGLAILAAGYVTAAVILWPAVRPRRVRRYPVRPYRELPNARPTQTKTDRYTLAA